jgi:PAS domain S-box-containing protein
VLRADGGVRLLHARAAPIRAEGRLLGFVGTAEDVSMRHQADEAVRTSERRYRELFERNLAGVYRTSIEGRVLECNQAFATMLGYGSPAEIANEPVASLYLSADDRKAFIETLLREKRLMNVEFMAQRKDGSLMVGLENVDLVEDASDGIAYLRGTVIDITERRQAQAALQQTLVELDRRNRELQDFAFVASHDLQEPLRKIAVFSERLIAHHSHELGEQARDYLNRSAQAALRMQTLIDDLLAYSRVATRRKPFIEVDLGRLLAGVSDDLEAQREACGGAIEIGELPKVDGDPIQLRQLFQNLVSNGLKFHPADRAPRVIVSAELVPGASATRRWSIRVEDDGIGFDPVLAEQIFAPFQRLHGRHEYEGTGLGLAIVRRIVERHQGSLRAEGRPGLGAVFFVELPARQPRNDGATS